MEASLSSLNSYPNSEKNSYPNSEKSLTIEYVRETLIPILIEHLNKAKGYLSNNHADNDEADELTTEMEKLRKDLIFIKQVFTGLDTFEKSTSDLFKVLQQPEHSLKQLLEPPGRQTRFHEPLAKQFKPKLGVLGEVIIKLKLLLPSPHKLLLDRSSTFQLSSIHSGGDEHLNRLLGLQSSEVFYKSQAFKDFQDVYNSLGVTAKLCLLSFSVFPANEVLKKSRLVHWWVGEEILYPPVDGETVEEIADGIFKDLAVKGCIEPVKKKRRSDVHSFKMHPLIRSAVIRLAKDVEFLDFDDKGRLTTEFSKSYRACLVSDSELVGSQLKSAKKTQVEITAELEKLQTIFNVNDSYPNFSQMEWSKLKNVKVLYLGRWHSRAKHHIELVDSKFLEALVFMTRLRFLSLRGISGIMELPDSLCKLVCLKILDLGACHNLEVLPKKISLLKKLTHLDMSECYLLDRMPKGIALLSKLEVLKGFIIGDPKKHTSCTLHDLSGLQKLKKLTINTSREDFPNEEELTVLQGFGSLQKLTIAWGGVEFLANRQNKHRKQDNVGAQPKTASTTDASGGNRKEDDANGIQNHVPKTPARSLTFKRGAILAPRIREHFEALEKLDLQCYPHMKAPTWLTPGMLKKLEKLYIRGGQLQSLGQVQESDKWTVEILRLKFLRELKMDWNDLQSAFPKLNYVEKFRCPKTTFFPCDETGVWLKPGN
ncbi:putative leucine-rich repeat domain, L domain-containing protein [Rosa chinensis]|uniref:Putative leucine-rich repeat domain, L domain-containing protein n=1 Tax=Rosa chinensis TaxID=74649 RepID=A0A2P6RDD2_ROSCH|nr:disease resistance protein RPM1 [Rosa chinensis]PRQ44459.1 putative leucine-rich repeat domain, L domain-containing protein [Rosa chinensis]